MTSSRATAAATSNSRRFARVSLRGDRRVSDSIRDDSGARGEPARKCKQCSGPMGAQRACSRNSQTQVRPYFTLSFERLLRRLDTGSKCYSFPHTCFFFLHTAATVPNPAPCLLRVTRNERPGGIRETSDAAAVLAAHGGHGSGAGSA